MGFSMEDDCKLTPNLQNWLSADYKPFIGDNGPNGWLNNWLMCIRHRDTSHLITN